MRRFSTPGLGARLGFCDWGSGWGRIDAIFFDWWWYERVFVFFRSTCLAAAVGWGVTVTEIQTNQRNYVVLITSNEDIYDAGDLKTVSAPSGDAGPGLSA